MDRYDPALHRRRTIRLRDFDYSQVGAYFVTICTQNRECLFGEVADGEMVLNESGQMIQGIWDESPEHYAGVEVDAFIVMPNHIHGIIVLASAVVGAGPRACPSAGQPQGVAPTVSLGDVVGRFKSLTTRRYIKGVKESGWKPFDRRLWQRNYYEHVIRDEDDLARIREYIVFNPAKWDEDENNPSNW